MLHAVLNNKTGPSLREDLLTAAFFGRLRYLSDEAQTAVMRCLLGEAALQLGPLQDLSFWPRYALPRGSDQQQVEPDLVMHFDAATVLVEVKPPQHGSQSIHQWTNELNGALQAGLRAPIHLLALGGNTPGNTALFDASRWPCELQLHTREWQDLPGPIAALRANTALRSDQAVLGDWLALLALHGLRSSVRIELPPLAQFIDRHRQELNGLPQWLRSAPPHP